MYNFCKHVGIAIVLAGLFGRGAPAVGDCDAYAIADCLEGFDSCSQDWDGILDCEALGWSQCVSNCTPEYQCVATIDLDAAQDRLWNEATLEPGKGNYDKDQWAVVFHYERVEIPAYMTVRFKNHHSGAPVVWLVSGEVDIQGTIVLDTGEYDPEIPETNKGRDPSAPPPGFSDPGPGGFAGGQMAQLGVLASPGFGPGGAATPTSHYSGGGGYRTEGIAGSHGAGGLPYGNAWISPLIGGSGGGGSGTVGGGGGAGAGAILIASSGTITLGHVVPPEPPVPPVVCITANGGDGNAYTGGGSGGAIRLMAQTIVGGGELEVNGGSPRGAEGRIRVESCDPNYYGVDPRDAQGVDRDSTPGPIFPPPEAPRVWVAQVDGEPVTNDDPHAVIVTTEMTINDEDQSVDVVVNAENIPIFSSTLATVTIQPFRGDVVTGTEQLTGTCADSTATITLDNVPRGRFEIFVKAEWMTDVTCP